MEVNDHETGNVDFSGNIASNSGRRHQRPERQLGYSALFRREPDAQHRDRGGRQSRQQYGGTVTFDAPAAAGSTSPRPAPASTPPAAARCNVIDPTGATSNTHYHRRPALRSTSPTRTSAPSDLTFQSISAGTGAGSAGVGISLDQHRHRWRPERHRHRTRPGSGGTIQHKTGADGSTTSGIGIYLNNTSEVSLNNMQPERFRQSRNLRPVG